jgi:hypothetical protein
MTEESQLRGARAGRKASGTSGKAPETRKRTQPKRAAPTRRKPRGAPTTASPVKSGPSTGTTETDATAEAATEREERLRRAEFAKALSEGGRTAAAKSWKDMTQGVDAMAAAEAVAKLSRVVAQAGAKDVLEGTKVLAASHDITSQSLAVGALSEEDLGIGLALAGIAGQLRAMTRVVDSLGTSVIVGFLRDRSERLERLAETVIQRAGATGALARTLAETSRAVAELGEAEVTEGEAMFTAAEEEADESEELAGEGLGLMMMGIAEAVQAHDLQQEADQMVAEGRTEFANGAETAG